MGAWGAGVGNVCCASVPKIWHQDMKVLVHWDMPEGSKHIFKEKVVDVEKYDEPGTIYLHFFPDDEVRVVVSQYAGWSRMHPIKPPAEPDPQLVRAR